MAAVSRALTPAERLVASMVAEGLTNLEIARELGVSARTVQAHVSHALAKLEISTRTALARVISREERAASSNANDG